MKKAKQIKKRALLVLMSVMTISIINAETIIVVNGLEYTLSGAYASVYGVADGNIERTISIPSTIEYENLQYTVNTLSNACFCNYFENYSGARGKFVDGVYSSGAPYCEYTQGALSDARRRAKNCSYLRNVLLPNTITSIGAYSFSNNNITSIKLNEGISEIGRLAFYMANITTIIIPSTVKSFEGASLLNGTFTECEKLRTIIYLSSTPPKGWTATSLTYVPSQTMYSSPRNIINDASIIEMISFSESTFQYTGNTPKLKWTNNVAGYNANFSIPELKMEVGTYEVIVPVSFAKGEDSFTAQIPYTYAIEPAKLKAKVKNASRAYGDQNPEFSITYTGFVNGENENVLTTKPTTSTKATAKSAVGTYPITISGGAAKNYTIEYEQGTLTVNKAPLNIQVMDAQRMYGSNNPTFKLSYFGLKNGETIPEWIVAPTYTTSATKESNVGTYAVNVSCEPKNYAINNNTSGTLTITKAPLTIRVNDVTMDYCGQMPTYTYTYSGFLIDDDVSDLSTKPTVTTTATATSNAGTYKITPTGAIATNYEMSYVAGTLTIRQRPLTVRANSISRLYGESNPELSVTYDGFVNNETKAVLDVVPTVYTTATPTSAVGTYPITISGGKAKNYTISYEQGTLTVNKASLSLQVMDAQKVYGSKNPTFILGYSGLKNGETTPEWITAPKFTTSATKESGVGTYDVNVNCEPRNYTITSNKSGTLTITKAPLTIRVNDATMDYCGQMPTYAYTYSGFLNGDNVSALSTKPTVSTTATATSNAGTYTITPTGAVADNYEMDYEAGTLTIKQRPLTVRANSTSKLYGENNPEFTISFEGFVNNETKAVLDEQPIASTTANILSGAGSYDIRVSGGSAINYALSYQSGQLTILPRPLTASVGNYERPYGQENPQFTINYEGFVGNDFESSLTTTPVTRTSATKTSNVGIYTIEVTGGYSPNYTLSYSSGTLTIVKAEQDIEWDQDLSDLKVGSQIELLAKASSELPITYTTDDNTIVEIYNAGSRTFMECKTAGTIIIKAVQEGNDNYFSTQRISKKVTIVDDPSLGINDSDNMKGIGIKIQATSYGIRVIDADYGDFIHIYNANGILLKSTQITESQMDINLNKNHVYIVRASNKTVKISL